MRNPFLNNHHAKFRVDNLIDDPRMTAFSVQIDGSHFLSLWRFYHVRENINNTIQILGQNSPRNFFFKKFEGDAYSSLGNRYRHLGSCPSR